MNTYDERMDIIGQNLRVYRKAKKISIESLSEKSNISVSTISHLENCRADNISIKALISLSDALEIDLESLISKQDFLESCNEADLIKTEDDLVEVIAASDKLKTYYPPTLQYNKISSLLEFLIIFPLLDPVLFYDFIFTLKGDTYSRGAYISQKLDRLWKEVPDSPAKRFAEGELELSYGLRQGEYDAVYKQSQKYKDYISDKNNEYDEYLNTVKEKHIFIKNCKIFFESVNEFYNCL